MEGKFKIANHYLSRDYHTFNFSSTNPSVLTVSPGNSHKKW